MINKQILNEPPNEIFNDYLDNLLAKDFPGTIKEIKNTLGWSNVTFSQKRSGKSPISPAEQIALNTILKTNVF